MSRCGAKRELIDREPDTYETNVGRRRDEDNVRDHELTRWRPERTCRMTCRCSPALRQRAGEFSRAPRHDRGGYSGA